MLAQIVLRFGVPHPKVVARVLVVSVDGEESTHELPPGAISHRMELPCGKTIDYAKFYDRTANAVSATRDITILSQYKVNATGELLPAPAVTVDSIKVSKTQAADEPQTQAEPDAEAANASAEVKASEAIDAIEAKQNQETADDAEIQRLAKAEEKAKTQGDDLLVTVVDEVLTQVETTDGSEEA